MTEDEASGSVEFSLTGKGESQSADDLPVEVADADLATDALAAARSMVSRSPRTRAGIVRARRRLRRERGDDNATYSGPRPDGRDPARLAAVLADLGPKLGWARPLAEARIFSQWHELVGEAIASRCQPVDLVDGVLKITAESTAWATQLRLIAGQLLSQINRELPAGTVRQLSISGPAAPTWKHGPWSMKGRGARDTYG